LTAGYCLLVPCCRKSGPHCCQWWQSRWKHFVVIMECLCCCGVWY